MNRIYQGRATSVEILKSGMKNERVPSTPETMLARQMHGRPRHMI